MHWESPFGFTDLNNEKKYFLETDIGGRIEYIPAIKTDDKYLNLIFLEEFNYNHDYEECEQAVKEICFT